MFVVSMHSIIDISEWCDCKETDQTLFETHNYIVGVTVDRDAATRKGYAEQMRRGGSSSPYYVKITPINDDTDIAEKPVWMDIAGGSLVFIHDPYSQSLERR